MKVSLCFGHPRLLAHLPLWGRPALSALWQQLGFKMTFEIPLKFNYLIQVAINTTNLFLLLAACMNYSKYNLMTEDEFNLSRLNRIRWLRWHSNIIRNHECHEFQICISSLLALKIPEMKPQSLSPRGVFLEVKFSSHEHFTWIYHLCLIYNKYKSYRVLKRSLLKCILLLSGVSLITSMITSF